MWDILTIGTMNFIYHTRCLIDSFFIVGENINMKKKFKKLNLRDFNDQKLVISDVEVPTLVPENIMQEFLKDDPEPYYKIQKIDYPIKANGYTYQEGFFETFLNKLNRSYIPGSKYGHTTSWGARPTTDLLLVGGKLEKHGDGSGSVYLKNYIPKNGESGDNTFFIKENKSNNVDYSLVAYTRDEVIRKDGEETIVNVLESLGGERNDAVEYGLGAMKQKTNKQEGGSKLNKKELLEGLKTLKANAEITTPEIIEAFGLEGDYKILSEIKSIIKKENVIDELKKIIAENYETKLNNICGEETDLRVFAETFFAGEITDEKIEAFKNNSIAKKLKAETADQTSKMNVVEETGNKEPDKPAFGGHIKI